MPQNHLHIVTSHINLLIILHIDRIVRNPNILKFTLAIAMPSICRNFKLNLESFSQHSMKCDLAAANARHKQKQKNLNKINFKLFGNSTTINKTPQIFNSFWKIVSENVF